MSLRPAHLAENLADVLRGRGYRLTPQRLAVIRALGRDASHPSAEEVHRRLLPDNPTLSLATVYKTIALLKQEGLLLEIDFGAADNRYDILRPYPHPHAVCTRCGAVSDPSDADVSELVERMTRETGYSISSHRLDFFGLCPSCRRKTGGK
ncbi:Fur family transcriptional regulator [Desulfovibrio sp.]